MIHEQDPIFDIIHSLPVASHSVAIATRTPTAAYGQKSKYMPDYGGVLDIPGTTLKNSALGTGIPFNVIPSPENIPIRHKKNIEVDRLMSSDCLAVSNYLNSRYTNQYSTITAFGKTLFVDLIRDNSSINWLQKSSTTVTNYIRIPYRNPITGIKYKKDLEDLLIVNLPRCVKIIKLNPSFKVYQRYGALDLDLSQESHLETDPAYKTVASIFESPEFRVKDACINKFTNSIVGVASDNIETRQVKLYDRSVSSKIPFQTFQWDSEESYRTKTINSGEKLLSGRVVRTFFPLKPAIHGIQQFEHVPSHLVNMLVTTSYQTILIDPRSSEPTQIFVDRKRLHSFYPIEYIRRSEFSQKNSYQFYSLSNVHLRAFDTRYPGQPVNQLNHMLESEAYDAMNLKVINFEGNDLETLCSSALSQLCFSTFDQSQQSKLINPKLVHMPYHEEYQDESTLNRELGLYGLEVMIEKAASNSKQLFSVVQLSSEGEIFVQKYEALQEGSGIQLNTRTCSEINLSYSKTVETSDQSRRRGYDSDSDIEERDALVRDTNIDDLEYINILDDDSTIGFRDKFGSKRAIERFEKMRNILDDT